MRKCLISVMMLIAALSLAACGSAGKGKSPIGKGKGKSPVVQTRG